MNAHSSFFQPAPHKQILSLCSLSKAWETHSNIILSQRLCLVLQDRSPESKLKIPELYLSKKKDRKHYQFSQITSLNHSTPLLYDKSLWKFIQCLFNKILVSVHCMPVDTNLYVGTQQGIRYDPCSLGVDNPLTKEESSYLCLGDGLQYRWFCFFSGYTVCII